MSHDSPKLTDPLWWTAQRLIDRTMANFSTTIIVTGAPGTGKSTLAIWIGMMVAHLTGREWDWRECVAYSGQDYLAAIEQQPRLSTVILNEGGEDLFSQEWWKEVAKAITKSQMTDRIYRKIKLIIIPFNMLLTKGIKVGACCRIHCSAWRGRRRARLLWALEDTSPFRKYADPFFTTIVDNYSFPRLPDEIEVAYVRYDLIEKERLNRRYVEKARKDAGWYSARETELRQAMAEGQPITSRDHAYNFFQIVGGEQVSTRDAASIWNKIKASV